MADAQVEMSRASEALSAAAESTEDKPIRCAKFRQQELWAWKPVWSPKVVIVMYLIVCALFIPLGIVIFVQSKRMVSTPRYRYDSKEGCDVGVGEGAFGEKGPSLNCSMTVEITRDVKGPAYLYYGLVNFYQNARTYVESRSFGQLRGEEVTSADECEPLIFETNGSIREPCGLVAGSFFNDSFFFCRDVDCQQPFVLNSSGIAWEIDRTTRYTADNELIRSEDFMVWMRASAYRNWKKLYRRIEGDIAAGNYTMIIQSQYPVASFGGEKFFFISETTWFGGPNQELGLSYIIVGGVCLILALMLLVKSKQSDELDLPQETSVTLDGISPTVAQAST